MNQTRNSVRAPAGDLPVAMRERAATRVARARRIDCYGVGNLSMFMASEAQARFARLGMKTRFPQRIASGDALAVMEPQGNMQ